MEGLVHTLYMEIFVMSKFHIKIIRVIFFSRGSGYPRKFIYTKKVLHGINFTLSSFYTCTHIRLISYYTSTQGGCNRTHTHGRAYCVHGYCVYREFMGSSCW